MATFLERYTAGEHESVWADLLALGARVRDEPLYADAFAVARETMRRARHNIELLIPRLRALGYAFGYDWAIDQRILTPESARGMERHAPPVSLPASKMEPFINELERRAGVLPLSLCAFYEIVGGVNFVGSHPVWGAYRLDALVVESATQAIELDDWMRWSDDKDERGVCALPIAPDEHHKYFVSGSIYRIRVPAPEADTLLEGEWHHTTFVSYLRTCFRWGGLTGLERARNVPVRELGILTRDLLPL